MEPETAAVIEEHLEGCVRCAVEVAQHHEVAGLLANSGGAPPASLWDGIAGQLGGTSDQSWDRLAARLDVPDGPPDGTWRPRPRATADRRSGDRGAPRPVRRRSRW